MHTLHDMEAKMQTWLMTHLWWWKWFPCRHGCGRLRDSGATRFLVCRPPFPQSGKHQGRARRRLRGADGQSGDKEEEIATDKGNKKPNMTTLTHWLVSFFFFGTWLVIPLKIMKRLGCVCGESYPVGKCLSVEVDGVHVHLVAHSQ